MRALPLGATALNARIYLVSNKIVGQESGEVRIFAELERKGGIFRVESTFGGYLWGAAIFLRQEKYWFY